jgi:hypothetical protein
MFIGHFAPAFVAAGVTNESPKLGKLFIGAQLLDWAVMVTMLTGIERMRIVPGITAMNGMDLYYMPYTHSLVGALVLGGLFALFVWSSLRNMVAACWAFIVVVSHWFLDLLVHRPDLTIAGGENKLGMGLWNSPLFEMPLEIGLILLAYLFYIGRTKGPQVPPLILLVTLLLFQAISWFGPQPREYSPGLILAMALTFAILTAMAFWVQSTRWHKSQVGLAVSSVRR